MMDRKRALVSLLSLIGLAFLIWLGGLGYREYRYSKEFKVHVTRHEFQKNPAYKEAVEFVREALVVAGYKNIKFVEMDNLEGFELLNQGKLDAALAATPHLLSQYPRIVAGEFPYLIVDFSIMSLVGTPKIEIEDLSKKIGVVNKDNFILYSIVSNPTLNVKQMDTIPQVFHVLFKKEADYTIVPKVDSLLDIAMFKKFKFSERPFIRQPFYFALAEKHSDDMKVIDEAMKKRISGDLSKYRYIPDGLNKSFSKP